MVDSNAFELSEFYFAIEQLLRIAGGLDTREYG
jgi:hypothetical protein